MANNFRIDPADRLELARPVVFVMRPGQPGSRVRFPFGGHAQVASHGLVDQTIGDGSVAVDAAVTQKRPVAANVFERANVHFAQQNLFFIMRCLGDHPSEGIAQERSAPEFEASTGSGPAADVPGFKTYTIDYCNVNPVGNRMSTLNGAPGVVLGFTKFRFLGGMPTNGSWIEKNMRALQRSQARAVGIPLVPADESSHAAHASVEGPKAKVAGREIEFFIIKRVVRDVHLAIQAENSAVLIESHGCVVIDPGGALLEQRCDQDDFQLFGYFGEFGRGRAGDGFGQIEKSMVFALAEVLRLKKF